MSTILLIILIILICAALPTLPYRSRGHNASVMGTSTQRTWLDRQYNLAGRYQGYHRFPNSTGSFEVFWRADGWWWWPRV